MSISSRIKPKHLELIVKITEMQQLQAAAKAVAMSQPAASRLLAELESQVGDALFIRHPTGMEPTPAGRAFARHGRVVLSQLETMLDELSHIQTGDVGHVHVGAVTGPAVGHLMPAIQAVLLEAPTMRISVDVAPSSVLFRGLEETKYDFILGRTNPRSNPQDYRFHPGRTEMISLMVHRSHPLADRDQVDIAELREFPWVIQEEGSPIREAVERAFHSESVAVPSRVLNSSSLLVALAHVVGGQAISPQTEEVMRLLTSEKMNANVTQVQTLSEIVVAPYFVIQHAFRKLPRAAERLLEEVMSRF